MQSCIHREENSPKPVNNCFTLQEGTSRTNNKQVISTFILGCLCLTLKEGSKVKSDHLRRFPAHDFLLVGFMSQTSWINNKRVISTFMFGYSHFTLKRGPRSYLTSEDSQPMIFYKLVSHCKSLGPVSEL